MQPGWQRWWRWGAHRRRSRRRTCWTCCVCARSSSWAALSACLPCCPPPCLYSRPPGMPSCRPLWTARYIEGCKIELPGQWRTQGPIGSNCCKASCPHVRHCCSIPGDGEVTNHWTRLKTLPTHHVGVRDVELGVHVAVPRHHVLVNGVVSLDIRKINKSIKSRHTDSLTSDGISEELVSLGQDTAGYEEGRRPFVEELECQIVDGHLKCVAGCWKLLSIEISVTSPIPRMDSVNPLMSSISVAIENI